MQQLPLKLAFAAGFLEPAPTCASLGHNCTQQQVALAVSKFVLTLFFPNYETDGFGCDPPRKGYALPEAY